MSDLIKLTIDGVELSVPPGTLVVDAAKMIGNDIPVFCYHPKMKPVGMCRMCLVDIGTPVRDRATGEPLLDDDGAPQIMFGRVLQTGCTVPVSEGMVVRTHTEQVTAARENVIEFLLTSHPLDCPICDKGGECPLQNLTMQHGKGNSRFEFSEKLKMDKHVPLGDLIYLDRERCIQCARCTRYQAEIVDDPVIAFHNRGRHLEIVTLSDPGFDSYWSGNTTDICPVGALTTTDFRFSARPWELTPVASLCNHCPVGCNTTLSTRRERDTQGRPVIKRVMPRQNEWVNEIGMCDKGRFGHHHADAPTRLTAPLIRKDGKLQEATWDEALDLVAGKLQVYKTAVAGLASGRLSNEDLYLFQKLFRQGLGSGNVDIAHSRVAGGDVIAQVGLSAGSNLKDLGAGDAVLVVASDLHEEAPVWWLRIKQAAERGAKLVVMNLRETRLDKFAAHVLHYAPGKALLRARQLLNAAKIEAGDMPDELADFAAAAETLITANNLVAFYGGEGLTYAETDTLARLLANLLLTRRNGGENHTGRLNNGLVAVWPHGNDQGAWDMGVHARYEPGYKPAAKPGLDAAAIYAGATSGEIQALYVMGADPVGDGLLRGRDNLNFLVVQELFLTKTAELADVVLPAQSWAEREGTYTNGERRVQRFYPAIPAVGQSRADWQILAQLGERVGLGKPTYAAGLIFREIAANAPQYGGMDYRSLARVEKQWPDVGGEDLYYGGTAYNNKSGLGQQWPVVAETELVDLFDLPEISPAPLEGVPVARIAALYTPGSLLAHAEALQPRMAQPTLFLHSEDAEKLQISDGEIVALPLGSQTLEVTAYVNGNVRPGLALVRGVPGQEGLLKLV
jgi:NADH-quinone oxidoreductase subunit G